MLSEADKAIINRVISEPMASLLLAGKSIGVGPGGMEALMNAVRAEERARAVEVVTEIRQWADEALNGGDIVMVRRLEGISDSAAAYLSDNEGRT